MNGTIYFLHAPACSVVKIGFTTDLQKRMHRLQGQAPCPLHLLGTKDGDRAMEQELHARFHKYVHIGEWFSEAPVLKFLEAWPHTEASRVRLDRRGSYARQRERVRRILAANPALARAVAMRNEVQP